MWDQNATCRPRYVTEDSVFRECEDLRDYKVQKNREIDVDYVALEQTCMMQAFSPTLTLKAAKHSSLGPPPKYHTREPL